MSYQYDPETRRYVLNTQHIVSTPSDRNKLSVSLDTPQSTRSPHIIRVTSKTKMVPFDAINPKSETTSLEDHSSAADLSKRQNGIAQANTSLDLKSQEGKFGKNDSYGLNSSKPLTALPMTDLSRTDRTDYSLDRNFSNSNVITTSRRPVTERQPQYVEQLPGAFIREPTRLNYSMISMTPKKASEQQPAKTIPEPAPTPQKQPVPSTALKQMSKLLTTQIEEKFRQQEDESWNRDKKVRNLQQNNMDARVENSMLQNEVNNLKTKLTMLEGSSKSQVENLKTQMSGLQKIVNNYEMMRHEISSRLGERRALAVEEIVNRVEGYIAEKEKIQGKLKNIDSEMKSMRDTSLNDKKLIDQLHREKKLAEENTQRQRNNSVSVDRNILSNLERERDDYKQQLRKVKDELANTSVQLNSSKQFQDIVQSNRHQISDLIRQLEDNKQQLRRARDQLANSSGNSKQLQDIVEANKRQMNDLSRQLEDHKQQLRKSKEDLANSSAQLSSLKQLQDIVESDKRQISDLSRQLQDQKQQLRRAKDQLANSSVQLSNSKQLQQIIEANKRQINDLSRQLEDHKQQLRRAKQDLANSSSVQMNSSKQFQDIIENDKRQLTDLTRQLEDHKLQLRRAKEQIANNSIQINSTQQLKQIIQGEKRKITDATRQMEEQKFQLNRTKDQLANTVKHLDQTKRNLTKANEKISSLEYEVKNAQSMLQTEKQQRTKYANEVSNYIKQLNQVQRSLQSAESELRSLKSTKSQLQQKISNLERNNSSLNDKIFNLQNQVSEKTRQLSRSTQNLQNTQKQLKQSKQDLKLMREDFNSITFLHTKKQKELFDLINKCNVSEANMKQKIIYFEKQIQNLKAKIQEKNQEHKKQQQFWQQEINSLMKLIEQQYQRVPNRNAPFEDILRTQVEEIQSLKRKLSQRQQKIFQLNEKISDASTQMDEIKTQFEIERLRNMTEKKSLKNSHQSELENVNSELEKSQKMVESLSLKIKQLGNQTKSKDKFIQNNLMGKQLTADEKYSIEQFFKDFQSAIEIANPKQELEKQHRRIEQLEFSNRLLARELKKLKQRR